MGRSVVFYLAWSYDVIWWPGSLWRLACPRSHLRLVLGITPVCCLLLYERRLFVLDSEPVMTGAASYRFA